MMNARRVSFALMTLAVIAVVSIGIFGAQSSSRSPASVSQLENVRDYAPAPGVGHVSHAVDGGSLLAGQPSMWRQIQTPRGVTVSAVALDRANPATVYIGAANRLVLYRSLDAGVTWTELPLGSEAGGITHIAVDRYPCIDRHTPEHEHRGAARQCPERLHHLVQRARRRRLIWKSRSKLLHRFGAVPFQSCVKPVSVLDPIVYAFHPKWREPLPAAAALNHCK